MKCICFEIYIYISFLRELCDYEVLRQERIKENNRMLNHLMSDSVSYIAYSPKYSTVTINIASN